MLGSKSRALTLFVIGGLLGAIMLSPVAAGPNDPATKKFVKKLVNKKTKKVKKNLQAQIDALSGSALVAAETKTTHLGPWVVNENINTGTFTPGLKFFSNITRLDSAGAGGNLLHLPLVAPKQLGKRLFGLKAVEICYTVTAGDRIDSTEILDSHSGGTATSIILDETDRTFAGVALSPLECYTVTLPSPHVPTGSLMLSVNFTSSAAADFVRLGSVVATWAPTASAPTAPSDGPVGGAIDTSG